MRDLLTAAQMRAHEQRAIESGAVSGRALMERAGEAVVEAMLHTWPELAQPRVGGKARGPAPAPPEYFSQDEEERDFWWACIFCGPGNNGGDGFVIARLLKAIGWGVEVFLYGDAKALPPDARANYELWRDMGPVHELSNSGVLRTVATPDVLIDSLFGIGLTRKIAPDLAIVLRAFEPFRAFLGGRCVAVDLPSGLCADSGRVLGAAPRVDLTVTFHRAKLGHYLAGADQHCGQLLVKDIGLDAHQPGEAVQLVTAAAPRFVAKTSPKHKFNHGHALILSGGSGLTGAARLAAKAALRIGAGLVTLGVPPAAQQEVARQITALMLKRVPDSGALEACLADERFNALCLGPGMGQERARDLVPVALQSGRACVLDADALSAFADAPEDLFAQLHGNCVLTPHGGEFARLFPDLAEQLETRPKTGPVFSKVDATRAAARRAGCVVLFKGADTVISTPDGLTAIHAASYDRAAPWLATAGAGDVLAGLITGLMARRAPPFIAAKSGAWLHVEAARAFGPGLIAEDIETMLPQVLRSLT